MKFATLYRYETNTARPDEVLPTRVYLTCVGAGRPVEGSLFWSIYETHTIKSERKIDWQQRYKVHPVTFYSWVPNISLSFFYYP